MTYKRKNGYRLKRGQSGEMRWHKIKKQEPQIDTPKARMRTKDGRVIYQQPSFKLTEADLNLDTHPDQFYNSRERLVIPAFDRAGMGDRTAPDTFFHGTRYEYQNFGESALDRPKNTGHWNNVLGSHFSASKDIAENFAHGKYGGVPPTDAPNRIPNGKPGRVIETVLGIRNPLVIPDESDFNAYAMAHIALGRDLDDEEAYENLTKSYGHDLLETIDTIRDSKDTFLKKLKRMKDIVGGISPGGFYESILGAKAHNTAHEYYDEEGRYIPKPKTDTNYRESHSPAYTAMMTGADGFKLYLEALGYDGIMYRNFIEGGIGFAPFSNNQITVLGEDRRTGVIHRPTSEELVNVGKRGMFREEHRDYNDEILMLQRDISLADDTRRDKVRTLVRSGKDAGSRFEGIHKARELWGLMYHPRGSDSLFAQIVNAHKNATGTGVLNEKV